MPQIPLPRHGEALQDLQNWLESQGVENRSITNLLGMFTQPGDVAFDLVGPTAVPAMTRTAVLDRITRMMQEAPSDLIRDMLIVGRNQAEEVPTEVLDRLKEIKWSNPIEDILTGGPPGYVQPGPYDLTEEMMQQARKSIQASKQGKLTPRGELKDIYPWTMSMSKTGDNPTTMPHEWGHLIHFLTDDYPMPEHELIKWLSQAEGTMPLLGQTIGEVIPHAGYTIPMFQNMSPADAVTNLRGLTEYFAVPDEAVAETFGRRSVAKYATDPDVRRMLIGDLDRLAESLKSKSITPWLFGR